MIYRHISSESYLKALSILWIGLFLLHSPDAFSQKELKRKKTPELEVEIGLASFYDDNILKYSDKYLEKFKNNQDTGRFHINTYDDIVLNPSLKLTGSYRLFGKLRSELEVLYSPRFYCSNSIKNWNFFTVSFRQYFTKRASIKLIYGYLPDYYLRHFQDDDWYAVYGDVPQQYQPMSYSKNNWGVWLQNTFFRNTLVRLSFYYDQYYYNPHFTEYDCKEFTYGIRITQPFLDRFKFEGAYAFSTSDAKGYDDPGETKENSDEADASYYENAGAARLTYEIPRFFDKKHNLQLEGSYQRRIFTSEHYLEVDPLHAGRYDNVFEVTALYELWVIKDLRIRAFYNWFMRDASTTAKQNQDYVSAEKDYRQNQVGIEVTYYLDFK
jgi:hypothetical protein